MSVSKFAMPAENVAVLGSIHLPLMEVSQIAGRGIHWKMKVKKEER